MNNPDITKSVPDGFSMSFGRYVSVELTGDEATSRTEARWVLEDWAAYVMALPDSALLSCIGHPAPVRAGLVKEDILREQSLQVMLSNLINAAITKAKTYGYEVEIDKDQHALVVPAIVPNNPTGTQ